MDYSSKAHFNNYDPSSFGWSRSADLVPFQSHGANFGQVARTAVPVFTALLDELVPHIPGGIAGKPLDDWGYSATDDLPDGSWSFHHYGIAIDVNWSVNHMGTNIPDPTGTGAIPRAWATNIARKYGCEWGGNWGGGFHDLMHFEIHLSPADARTVVGPTPAPIDPLEEIMALYDGHTLTAAEAKTKANFEAAMSRIVNTWNTASGPHSADTAVRMAVSDHVDDKLASVLQLVAAIPGRLATLQAAVAAMKPGDVVVDTAAIVTGAVNGIGAKLQALTFKAQA